MMRTELADDLFTVAGVLTAAECRALIDRGEGIGFESAAVRTRLGAVMRPDLRDNDRAGFADPHLADDLWARCAPAVPAELEGGRAVGLDPGFRFYRYDVAQSFSRHRDGVVARSPTVRTRLTCLLYLNDDFRGGETAFHQLPRSTRPIDEPIVVVPRAGDALFFRHEWLHEGRPVASGHKYVLRSDVFFEFPASPMPEGPP